MIHNNQDPIFSHTMKNLEINKEPVELYKILKLGNMTASGGEAKYVISEGLVKVNGVVETRKRKKLFNGDIIEFDTTKIQLHSKQ